MDDSGQVPTKRIMLIDNNITTRVMIHGILEEAGHNSIDEIESIDDAISFLKDTDDTGVPRHSTDLILINTTTPGLDAIEIAHALRGHDILELIPIIIISSDDNENLERAFSAGASDYIKKPVNPIELRARVGMGLKLKHERDARRQKEDELNQANKGLSTANEMLQTMSRSDGLTGIPNRMYFDEVFEVEWFRALRDKLPVSALMIDIDYFKKYNDTYGHLAGDTCLKQVATVIQDSVKRAGDFAARYGGEEFIVLLPNHGADDAMIIANHIAEKLAALKIPHKASDAAPHVTVSIGIASAVPEDTTTPNLVDYADKALYEAKHQGRNRVVVSPNSVA